MVDRNVDFGRGIPFTRYLLRPEIAERHWFTIADPAIVGAARHFVDAGGWYEYEVLGSGEVAVSAHTDISGADNVVARQVTDNGPSLVNAVATMVRESASTLTFSAVSEMRVGDHHE